MRRVVRPERGAEDLGVAQDHRQQVVEVVSDPAREATHRVHLLRLAELRLALAERLGGLPELGDVVMMSHDPADGRVGEQVDRRDGHPPP